MALNRLILLTVAAAALAACGGPDTDLYPPLATETEASDQVKELEADAAPEEEAEPDTDARDEPYDHTWNMFEFWPGEYPPGVSVLADGVVLQGRVIMDPNEPADIACPVQRGANYQPWNGERNITDKLKYVAATQTYPVTITKDVMLSAFPIEEEAADAPSDDQTLDLKVGDALDFLIYIAEGFANFEYGGVSYQIDQQELRDVSDLETAGEGADQHLWMRITCDTPKREQVWLRLEEAEAVDNVQETLISGWGESSDLDEAALAEALAFMEQEAQNSGD